MHKRWGTMIKQQKSIQQKLKNTKGVSEYFSDIPEVGYMRDNISKKVVKITECKSSTLRRYTKLLSKYYNLVKKPEERKIINDKLTEVKAELDTRPDAIIEKEE